MNQSRYFLTGGIGDLFRARMQQMESLFEQTPSFSQVGRRLGLEDELNFLRDIFNVRNL